MLIGYSQNGALSLIEQITLELIFATYISGCNTNIY